MRKFLPSIKKTLLDRASKIWLWITVIFLALGLILIGNSIYQEQKEQIRQQEITNLQSRLQELQAQKDQVHQQYQLQTFHLISTATLAKSPTTHSFFTNLLTTYAEKFAKIKQLDISDLPLSFEGFYLDEKTGKGFGEMGRCGLETIIYPIRQKVVKISLNHLYLLNKFGHEEYFTSSPQGDCSCLDISFKKMLKTCSHELAHYIQLVKHGKSICESDLILGNGEYDKELAKEHEEFAKEIYGMIKQEYSEWEKRWREV